MGGGGMPGLAPGTEPQGCRCARPGVSLITNISLTTPPPCTPLGPTPAPPVPPEADAESFEEFGKKVNGAGGSAEVFVYEGCGHAFLNTGPEGIAKR